MEMEEQGGTARGQEIQLGEPQYELLLSHVYVFIHLISFLNNHKLLLDNGIQF